jgi:hypothetical protein
MRIYGTIGTRVSVLKNDNELLLVQDQDHNKFFVKPNDLSDDPQTIKERVQAKTVAKKTRR